MLIGFICNGRVKPGERISLPTLAKELGVSVTPIREALTQLTEAGAVTYIANRGFFVTELDQEEAIEIYELMAVLECEAIRQLTFTPAKLKALKSINAKMEKATSNEEKLFLDRDFHQALISGYQNQTVLKIIEDLRIKISLYDFAFWDENSIDESVPSHNMIVDYLAAGDMHNACDVLRDNWLVGAKHIQSGTST